MSELTRARRIRIIAGVLVIGLLVGFAEIVAYERWSDWEDGIFTPVSAQITTLAWGVFSIGDANWGEALLLLLVGSLLFALTSFCSVAPLLVSESKRRFWASFMLILLLVSSAIGWWSNWPLLQWGPKNTWRRPLACVAGALLVLCLIAGWFWRRNPDGRAAFWYPAMLQIWIQSLWIPWPDVD